MHPEILQDSSFGFTRARKPLLLGWSRDEVFALKLWFVGVFTQENMPDGTIRWDLKGRLQPGNLSDEELTKLWRFFYQHVKAQPPSGSQLQRWWLELQPHLYRPSSSDAAAVNSVQSPPQHAQEDQPLAVRLLGWQGTSSPMQEDQPLAVRLLGWPGTSSAMLEPLQRAQTVAYRRRDPASLQPVPQSASNSEGAAATGTPEFASAQSDMGSHASDPSPERAEKAFNDDQPADILTEEVAVSSKSVEGFPYQSNSAEDARGMAGAIEVIDLEPDDDEPEEEEEKEEQGKAEEEGEPEPAEEAVEDKQEQPSKLVLEWIPESEDEDEAWYSAKPSDGEATVRSAADPEAVQTSDSLELVLDSETSDGEGALGSAVNPEAVQTSDPLELESERESQAEDQATSPEPPQLEWESELQAEPQDTLSQTLELESESELQAEPQAALSAEALDATVAAHPMDNLAESSVDVLADAVVEPQRKSGVRSPLDILADTVAERLRTSRAESSGVANIAGEVVKESLLALEREPVPTILVELFSGHGDVSSVAAKIFGCSVVGLDIEPKGDQSITLDVRAIQREDIRALRDNHPNVRWLLWASPPCTEYSRAHTRSRRDLTGADELVTKVWDFIDILQPARYWIENPVGLLREREVMTSRQHNPPLQFDYCQYGKAYRKPTNIWTGPQPLHSFQARRCQGHGGHGGCLSMFLWSGKWRHLSGVDKDVAFRKRSRVPKQAINQLLGSAAAEVGPCRRVEGALAAVKMALVDPVTEVLDYRVVGGVWNFRVKHECGEVAWMDLKQMPRSMDLLIWNADTRRRFSEDSEPYPVERYVRIRAKTREMRIRWWKCYHETWEPLEHLQGVSKDLCAEGVFEAYRDIIRKIREDERHARKRIRRR